MVLIPHRRPRTDDPGTAGRGTAAAVFLLVASAPVSLLSAAGEEEPPAPGPSRRFHELVAAAGLESGDLFALVGYTSPVRIGGYIRPFRGETERETNALTNIETTIETSGGEAGLAVRALPTLTIGLGWARFERTREEAYYQFFPFLGWSVVARTTTTEVESGLSGFLLGQIPFRNGKMGLTLGLHGGFQGMGGSIGVAARIPSRRNPRPRRGSQEESPCATGRPCP